MTSTDIEPDPMDFDDSRLICRLCLSEDSLANVFAEKGLQKWISEFLSIGITTEDHLSQAVCAKCRIRLVHFNQYRVRCHKVQSLLKAKMPEHRKGSYPAQLSVPLIQCDVCHKVFTLKRHLKDHKRNHWRKNICKWCGKSYVERKRLEKHIKKAHENKTREDQKNSKSDEKQLVVPEVREIKNEPLWDVEDSTTEMQDQKIEEDVDSGHIGDSASSNNEHPIKLEHDAENPSFVYDVGDNLCALEKDEKQSALEDIFVVEEIKVEAPCELDEALVSTDEVDEFDEYELMSQSSVHSEELVASSMEHQMEVQKEIQNQCKEAPYVRCENMFTSQPLPFCHNESLHESKNFSCLICGFRFETETDMQLHRRSNGHLNKIAESPVSGTSYVIIEINNTANKPIGEIVNINTDSATDLGDAYMPDYNKSPLSEELDDLKQQPNIVDGGSSSIKLSATSVNNAISYACFKCNHSFSRQCQLENHMKIHDDDVTDIDDEHLSMTGEDGADDHGKPIPKEDHKLLVPGLKISLLRHSTEEHHSNPNHRMNTAEERSSVANSISLDEMSQEDSNTDGDVTYSESVIAASQNPIEISDPESMDDDGRTVCTKCGKVFYDLQGFWMHYKNAHKKILKCSLCNVVFSYEKRLENHLLTKHKKQDGSFQPLKCEECNKVFPTTSKFTAHMALHGPRIHCCKFCPRTFSRPQHLKSHVKSHEHVGEDLMIPASSRPGYECAICHKVLQLKKHMQSHIRRDHGSELHKCSICSRLFKAREELEIHLESHEDEVERKEGEFSGISGNGMQSLSEPETANQSQQSTLSVVSNPEASSYQCHDSITQSSVSEQTMSLQLLQHAKRGSQKETPAGLPDDSLDVEANQQSSSNYLRHLQKDELFEIEDSQDINDENTEKEPTRHNLESLSRADHPCSMCKSQFTSKMELEQHTKTNHPEDVGIQKKSQAHKNPVSSLEKSVANEAEELNIADAPKGPVLLFEAGQFKIEPE